MFEMCVYTMGNRSYAEGTTRLLDPGKTTSTRDLDVVLGAESVVIILDDTKHVWEKHRENLILMDEYRYFSSRKLPFKSLSELKRDESEPVLVTILEVLKRIHQLFFFDLERDDDLMGRDVRQVLKTVRAQVLKGCKLVFSRVDRNKRRWKVAGELGATCCKELDSSVTHVVSTDVGTRRSRWAVKHDQIQPRPKNHLIKLIFPNKFLVHPRWIKAAYSSWKRQPENSFVVGC
ncbi:hypothetical protein MKW94_014595 [Papaver nudicaule]|uniref:protein-serine/threonine phosphatase n=1 Tax=Papaver nudicaule TaxID=74823 RepID=A0AA41V6I1_PAPNU|nr:hypothetical protein [Papaver nudicaule]